MAQIYTQSHCQMECSSNYSLVACNCTRFWLPSMFLFSTYSLWFRLDTLTLNWSSCLVLLGPPGAPICGPGSMECVSGAVRKYFGYVTHWSSIVAFSSQYRLKTSRSYPRPPRPCLACRRRFFPNLWPKFNEYGFKSSADYNDTFESSKAESAAILDCGRARRLKQVCYMETRNRLFGLSLSLLWPILCNDYTSFTKAHPVCQLDLDILKEVLHL